jgi:hypothetical protein
MLVSALLAAAPIVFTNEEQVYFDREGGRAPPPWTAVELEGGALRSVDAFGRAAPAIGQRGFKLEGDTLTLFLADGSTRVLRRARPVSCWGSSLKGKPKPDGAEDWTFTRGLKLHDQGGRAAFGGEDGSRPVVLRMRNVIWPSGPNRPSLVLYVHTPEDPERAVSYSWADPDARRIGINLRWMQASCTIDGSGGKE